ncbi:MAG: IMP dehydrogenase [Nitrospinae bacterium]|nr:IMP dehydrogenase [Nitrospinota bacterium]
MLDSNLPLCLTFDDVLLVPQRSSVLPKEVSLGARLTKRINLNCPLVSAPMDTVTGANMAIGMAQEGGIGIIHKNMSIQEQSREVYKVKRSVSGMITDPITMSPDQKISEALEIMAKYDISGIPITENDRLAGILTNRDLRFEKNLNKKISEMMTRNDLVTVPVGTTLEQSKELLHKNKIEKLLVVGENGSLKGLITIKDIEKSQKYPIAAKDARGSLLVGAAVGVSKDAMERVKALVGAGVDVLVVDAAHGHAEIVLNTIRTIKKAYPGIEVIGGNVATREGAMDIIRAGADAVKVGIGPGSICTTRVVAGVGVPQLSAIAECARVTEPEAVPLIADGGIKYSGDIVKALAAGANSVMIGGLFAGTEESPGERILFQGRSYKAYRGMGSIGAMLEGGGERYFQEREFSESKLVPEGVEGKIPYKGSISFSIFQLLGGLRSGMGYCGCKDINELRANGKFVRISPAALRESHVHDVIVTKEAPNYRMENYES